MDSGVYCGQPLEPLVVDETLAASMKEQAAPILHLWVYPNNPVSIQCNHDELIKCNDLVLPCSTEGEILLTSAKEKR